MKTAPKNTSTCQISATSVRGFGSYEHLKFRPMGRLKYRLWRHNDVIVVTSQIFCYHCVEYIKLDTCTKFYDHRSNNNKVMMRALMPPPPPPTTNGSKKPMSDRVKYCLTEISSNNQGPFPTWRNFLCREECSFVLRPISGEWTSKTKEIIVLLRKFRQVENGLKDHGGLFLECEACFIFLHK